MSAPSNAPVSAANKSPRGEVSKSPEGGFVLEATGLGKHYELKKLFRPSRFVKALDGVSFRLRKGETLAVVGESGCGKSTLAKVLTKVENASFGEVKVDGKTWTSLTPADYRKKLQMVFQDPYSSVNPRKKAGAIIAEPLAVNTAMSGAERRARALELMDQVGLRPEYIERYPHMFSGGQRQRIGIARALVLCPEVLVLDEPVSALDISIQAQVLNLLLDLQDKLGLSYVFITHDLSVVRHIANEVLVMYLGKVVEHGTREAVLNDPKHPYTKALLASTPTITGKAREATAALTGELPSPLNPPPGCTFHRRCPLAVARCREDIPAARKLEDGRSVACHLV